MDVDTPIVVVGNNISVMIKPPSVACNKRQVLVIYQDFHASFYGHFSHVVKNVNATLIVEVLLDQPWVPSDLPDPQPEEPFDITDLEIEDLAAEYIEGEVGRFDYQHNWPQHKSQHGKDLRAKVMAWLKLYEIDHDPDALIAAIDAKVKKHPDQKWL